MTDDDRAPDVKDFDFGAWLSGATETIRSVKLYARADLLAQVDELEQKQRALSRVPDEDRSITDEDPQQRLAELYEEFEASAVTIQVRGRSDEWRDKVTKRLNKTGVRDDSDVILHQIAESIVSPDGVTFEHLARFREVSAAQVAMLMQTYILACTAPPRVDAPFSQGSSPTQRGRRS